LPDVRNVSGFLVGVSRKHGVSLLSVDDNSLQYEAVDDKN
jgi:hypothetical protein